MVQLSSAAQKIFAALEMVRGSYFASRGLMVYMTSQLGLSMGIAADLCPTSSITSSLIHSRVST
jgi:hypothetical protein